MPTQKFSYHTHTNSFGTYDGKNSAQEMISRAEEIGYTELGISNHLCYHPNMQALNPHPMFQHDFNTALDLYLRTVDEIRTASLKAKIPVKVGFEVDFFPSALWRNDFEKFLHKLNLDYVIGATHFIRSEDESFVCNLYRRDGYNISPEEMHRYLQTYWENVIACINSGYFNFIAHLDVTKVFGLCLESEWDEYKWRVIEALASTHTPTELNTSGWNKSDEQHPHTWMLKELSARNVPVIISDDAHSVAMLGQHFDRAEKLLADLNYTNRWKL